MTTDDKKATRDGEEAAVDDFIHRKGITRCPTACAGPTQGEVDATDRAALAEYAIGQERSRQARAAQRARPFWLAIGRWPDRG